MNYGPWLLLPTKVKWCQNEFVWVWLQGHQMGSLSITAGRPKYVFQCPITAPLFISTHTLNTTLHNIPAVWTERSKNSLPQIKACAEEGKIWKTLSRLFLQCIITLVNLPCFWNVAWEMMSSLVTLLILFPFPNFLMFHFVLNVFTPIVGKNISS